MQYLIRDSSPDEKVIKSVVRHFKEGHVVIYPTDSLYAMGALLTHQATLVEKLALIERDKDFGHLALLVDSFEMAQAFAEISTPVFREIRAQKGPATWVLPANRLAFKRLKLPKREQVGIRICANPFLNAVIKQLGLPIVSASLEGRDPDYWQYGDPDEISSRFGQIADIVVQSGFVMGEPSVVIDRTGP